MLFSYGETPIPEYIKRAVVDEDEERYQTIYATEEGAVVAPAAGLHFSRELLKRLELQDVRAAHLTLHCSPVMNAEIDVDDLHKYKMGSERMIVPEECCDIVNRAKRSNNKICVVGTSTLKAIETCLSTDGFIKPYDGWTGKFIFPEYRFTLPTSMITGFHMPYSSLLMSVAAFGGYKQVMNAYKVAIEEGYRFGAYGDAMLII